MNLSVHSSCLCILILQQMVPSSGSTSIKCMQSIILGLFQVWLHSVSIGLSSLVSSTFTWTIKIFLSLVASGYDNTITHLPLQHSNNQFIYWATSGNCNNIKFLRKLLWCQFILLWLVEYLWKGKLKRRCQIGKFPQ